MNDCVVPVGVWCTWRIELAVALSIRCETNVSAPRVGDEAVAPCGDDIAATCGESRRNDDDVRSVRYDEGPLAQLRLIGWRLRSRRPRVRAEMMVIAAR